MKNEDLMKDVLLEMRDSHDPTSPILLWKLNNAIEAVLMEQFGSFCPDVFELANKLNINILYEDGFGFDLDNVFKPIAYYSWSRKEIHIDKKIPYNSRRCVIAYGIAAILLKEDTYKYFDEYYYEMEIWPNSKEEVIKNNFALLLLHSVHRICELLEEYYCAADNYERKSYTKLSTTTEWIRYLKEICGTREHYATSAYQIFKNIMGMADVIGDIELMRLRNKLNVVFRLDDPFEPDKFTF